MATNRSEQGPVQRLAGPAVALMNRLTYPRKFAVISLLFALPLGLAMYSLVVQMNDRIEFARKEIQGDQYFRPLQRLFEHVLQSRVLARSYAGGQVSVRAALVRKQAEIGEDIASLHAVDQKLGQILNTTRKHDALIENWSFLREQLFKLEAVDIDELHGQLLAEIRDLQTYVGDVSNLVLDPDLDSYYLMDATLIKLPRNQDLLAQALLLGHQIIPGARMPKLEERTEIVRLAGLLLDNRQQTERELEVAFRNNPAANLKSSLNLSSSRPPGCHGRIAARVR